MPPSIFSDKHDSILLSSEDAYAVSGIPTIADAKPRPNTLQKSLLVDSIDGRDKAGIFKNC